MCGRRGKAWRLSTCHFQLSLSKGALMLAGTGAGPCDCLGMFWLSFSQLGKAGMELVGL